MSRFESKLPLNILLPLKNPGKVGKELNAKANQTTSPTEQIANSIQQNQTNPAQSLVNTNSNVVINQPTQTSPGLNQAALNASNLPQTNLNQQDIKNTLNTQLQSTPSQVEFQGPSDLPAYAGVANMSLKSWIAGSESKGFTNLESGEKQLTATLEGIKGFQRQNYEGSDGEGSQKNKNYMELLQNNRTKNLIILSHIFSTIEQSCSTETELIVNLNTFRKLGSALKDGSYFANKEDAEIKLSPPLPNEPQKLDNIDFSQIRYLQQLLALPHEFPECLRLFAKEEVEINPKELNYFLSQRLKLVQEQLFDNDNSIGKIISNFIPLLNQNDYSALLPLILLYYPLPLPNVKEDHDFLKKWKKKKKEEKDLLTIIIASCEIYYLSKTRGRFLLKFELNEKHELTFDIQTSKVNNGIVKELEEAVAESMFLLECPPLLTDLNVKLTKEIYKATDIDEELSIVSHGPLRIEIVLAVYSALLILNKLNEEPDPSGIIDIVDNE